MSYFFSTPKDTPDEYARKIKELRNQVSDLLDDRASQAFCCDVTLKRYLDARQGNLKNAVKALRHTLEWRKETRPHLIKYDEELQVMNTGRIEVCKEPDKLGRTVCYHRLTEQMYEHSTTDLVVKHWTFLCETASFLADQRGSQKIVLIADMKKAPGCREPPLSCQVECLRLTQTHYPERLALAVVCNPPTIFWILWRAIQPFMDHVTRSKVVFANTEEEIQAALGEHVDAKLVYTSLGGEREDVFYPDTHAELLNSVHNARIAAWGIEIPEE